MDVTPTLHQPRYLPATAPETLLGKAIRYPLRLWPRRVRYLEAGRLPMSHTRPEPALKQVVMGRKNVRCAVSPAGARANRSAWVETATATGWERWRSLKQLFTALPAVTTVGDVEARLSWKIQPGELYWEYSNADGPTRGLTGPHVTWGSRVTPCPGGHVRSFHR